MVLKIRLFNLGVLCQRMQWSMRSRFRSYLVGHRKTESLYFFKIRSFADNLAIQSAATKSHNYPVKHLSSSISIFIFWTIGFIVKTRHDSFLRMIVRNRRDCYPVSLSLHANRIRLRLHEKEMNLRVKNHRDHTH